MTVLTKVRAGLQWVCAVEHWTAIVAIGFVAVVIVQLVGIAVGLTTVTKSPGGTVEALYQAAQDGDYDGALELLDSVGRQEANAMGREAWQALVGDLSRGHTITEMEFGNQRVYGKNAVVGIFVSYGSEHLVPRVEELVREGTHWRVMWEPGTRRFIETVQKYDPWFGK